MHAIPQHLTCKCVCTPPASVPKEGWSVVWRPAALPLNKEAGCSISRPLHDCAKRKACRSSLNLRRQLLICTASRGERTPEYSAAAIDHHHIRHAIKLAGSSAGLTAPHPNCGCIIAHDGVVVGEGFLFAQGTKSAEAQAVEQAGAAARGATAYLNLEPGDCHGDSNAVQALVQGGISRVVIGLQHPLPHLQGRASYALREAGLVVDLLEPDTQDAKELIEECAQANEALVYRAAFRMPFAILKYAMTLDGKIAASTGHAAWVSSREARRLVFEARGLSDAIIVGGNTVRRDNPRLTTRKEGGHLPVRIVMSRTLRLPEDANLWDVSAAPTIVMTQKGAREDFQARLAAKGVEIVEFDFLTPSNVMDYCYQRGFLQVLWECGGMLSAPAIQSGAIHKVLAFVCPKIIGGVTAPSPVGDLGFVEMTQALQLSRVFYDKVGPDMLVTGYLKEPSDAPAFPTPLPELAEPLFSTADSASRTSSNSIGFYKVWDPYGAFSNFSPHPIAIEGEKWPCIEHYYQAQKFAGVNDPLAQETVEAIRSAKSPEEAARMGRKLEQQRPDLVRPDWEEAKLAVMRQALHTKFATHKELADLLESTGTAELAEASPHDRCWGTGRCNTGSNHLGRLLMELRDELQTQRTPGQHEQRSVANRAK